MPSRADLAVAIERGLRAVLIAALAVLLWQSLHKQPSADDRDVRSRTLSGMLTSWTRAATAPERIHAQLDSVPGPLERDWLRALAAAGSKVTWSGDLTPLMIAAQPIASPAGGLRVSIAAPAGSVLELRDEVGVIDTVGSKSSGASLVTSSAARELTARADHSSATATPRDSLSLHKVLVIADAGWESKFVIAALEEDGWKVDAFVRVAPGVDVTQGSIAVIDTSRYSAVVALDNAVAPYAARINEFVRSGGGIVMAPAAAGVDAFAPLRSGVIGRLDAGAADSERSAGHVGLASFCATQWPPDRRRSAWQARERRDRSCNASRRRPICPDWLRGHVALADGRRAQLRKGPPRVVDQPGEQRSVRTAHIDCVGERSPRTTPRLRSWSPHSARASLADSSERRGESLTLDGVAIHHRVARAAIGSRVSPSPGSCLTRLRPLSRHRGAD